jgi:uncharacterized protein
MLVRFSVKNYRSFRDEQVLSLEAGRQAIGRKGRTFDSGTKTVPNLLHGAVIYGANSGGKTNLIRALHFMQEFIADSARGQLGDEIDVEPYRLDPGCRKRPSEFEIVFIVHGTVYQYGFSADYQRVHAEWLYETPAEGRIRHMFSRETNKAHNDYDWYINPRVRGERKLWQESTRDNALFLSTAIQLNSLEFQAPFDWIKSKLRVLMGNHLVNHQYTAHRCHVHDEKRSVLDIVRAVDVGVFDIKTTEDEISDSSIPSDIPESLRNKLLKEMRGQKVYGVEIGRKAKDGKLVYFDLDDESTGTNILYNLAAPWLDTLCNGYTLVMDELDSSLHPLALRTLVSMFFDASQNTGNAQLVITCHEATLLKDDLLRSDQVWFVDRTTEEGSKLYPLSEFRPRQNESFLRGYLGGRYGGIPVSHSVA